MKGPLMKGRLDFGLNLAKEPFRSFVAYHAAVAILAVLATAALGVEIYLTVSRLGERSMLSQALAESRAQMVREEKELRALESLDSASLRAAKKEARAVMGFVRRRAFDWNELLGTLEKVLPDDARLRAIEPQEDDEKITVSLSGEAKSLRVLNLFIENVSKASLLGDPFVAHQSIKGGTVSFTMEVPYLGSVAGPSKKKGAA